jgi:hypothetical protein
MTPLINAWPDVFGMCTKASGAVLSSGYLSENSPVRCCRNEKTPRPLITATERRTNLFETIKTKERKECFAADRFELDSRGGRGVFNSSVI